MSINTLFLKVLDPSGQVRRFPISSFPMTLGTKLDDRNQLRDPRLFESAFVLSIEGSDIRLTAIQDGLDLVVGDLRVKSLVLPYHVSVRIADTELTFSKEEFKVNTIIFPVGEKPWYTESKVGLELLKNIQQAASTKLSVYLCGETGTGKEVLSKLIHVWSERVGRPFVTINCAALPLSLVESELFGHVKGSFTGAVRDRPGAFLQAHGGTLFLDEVGDLPLEVQVKLLRFLENGELRPVGSDRIVHSDVRIICATHKALSSLVKEGKFRQDLYFRLASIPIEIPSLRSRPEDIEALSVLFAREHGKNISALAIRKLMAYPWPGNVRELRHAIERAVGQTSEFQNCLTEDSFQFLTASVHTHESELESQSALPGVYSLNEMEKILILRALKMTRGNRAEAAKILGVARSTLFEMLKRHRIVGPKSNDYWLQELNRNRQNSEPSTRAE